MQKKNYNRSKPEILISQAPFGHRRFHIGCVFVEYDLFYTTTFIKNCINEFSYKDTVLYQFLETGTSETS